MRRRIRRPARSTFHPIPLREQTNRRGSTIACPMRKDCSTRRGRLIKPANQAGQLVGVERILHHAVIPTALGRVDGISAMQF
jgi:hypothetical protein